MTMKHGTMIHPAQRPDGMVALAGLLVVTVTIGASMVAWQMSPQTALPEAAVQAAPAQDRTFVDEAGYVVTADEYAALGESYLPARAAVKAPAQDRTFVDEAGYVVTADEYAALGESYLPAPEALAPSRPVMPRAFADEMLSAATLHPVVSPAGLPTGEVTPNSGPR
jgi:hypothetical protein